MIDLFPQPPHLLSKLLYTIGYFIAVIMASVLRANGAAIFNLSTTGECTGACWNIMAVYRISLGLVLYHALLTVLLLGVTSSYNPRAVVQNRLWLLKLLLWGGTIAGCFFIPVSQLYSYWIVALVFSSIFIIIQAMFLVSFAHSLAESWIEKYDMTGAGMYKTLIIGTATLAYAGWMALSVISFLFFSLTDTSGDGASGACRLNNFVIGFNLALAVVATVAVLLPRVREGNPRAGLLQSSFIVLYNTYLVASTVAADPFGCKSSGASASAPSSFSIATQAIGMVFTLITLAYSAFSAATTQPFNQLNSPSSYSPSESNRQEEETVLYSWFQFIFVLAAFYMASVLTNWVSMDMIVDTGSFSNPVLVNINTGVAAAWVKLGTSWCNYLLFLWSLFAPVIFPNREFG